MAETSARYAILERMPLPESAAFIAALSRFLSSPDGMGFRDLPGPLEVRCEIADDHATVFLSESAYRAAVARFDPIPVTGSTSARAASAAPLVFTGDAIPAWGSAAAEQALRAIGAR